MTEFDYKILQCPITKEELVPADKQKVSHIISAHPNAGLNQDNVKKGFVNASNSYFYPIMDDIILLLPAYALFIGKGEDQRKKMAFDKKRVFNYYNEISYDIKDGYKVYKDSPKWVDYREITRKYLRNSFTKARQHLNPGGKYLLDIASGPIGLEEYLSLSDHFEYRICVDISVKALIQAKQNYSPKKGIYICGDITNIPLNEHSCDSVLCQHTLYHIPKNEQKTAVNELYRVAKTHSNIAIVYCLFYRSLFMNLAIFPVQVYRILRHIAGKMYVRLFRSKPRLYFHPHSLRWFKRNFTFSKNINFYCWRSTNKYFLNLYIHKWLRGEKLLEMLKKSEEKYPRFWGRIGEYPIIVIKKEGQ